MDKQTTWVLVPEDWLHRLNNFANELDNFAQSYGKGEITSHELASSTGRLIGCASSADTYIKAGFRIKPEALTIENITMP